MSTQLTISLLIILAMMITKRFDFQFKVRNEFKSGTKIKSELSNQSS